MKRILLTIGLVISAGLVLAACNNPANQLSKKKQAAKDKVTEKINQKTNDAKEKVAEKIKKVGKVKEAITGGKPIQCTVNLDNGKSKTQFFTDGKGNYYMEQEFTDDQGEVHNNRVIVANGKLYTWDVKTKKGTVMNQPKLNQNQEENNPSITPDNTTDDDLNKTAYLDEDLNQFSCSAWFVNPNKFKPPVDVEFVDMNQKIKDAREKMKQACNFFQGKEKQDCLDNIDKMGQLDN